MYHVVASVCLQTQASDSAKHFCDVFIQAVLFLLRYKPFCHSLTVSQMHVMIFSDIVFHVEYLLCLTDI